MSKLKAQALEARSLSSWSKATSCLAPSDNDTEWMWPLSLHRGEWGLMSYAKFILDAKQDDT